MARRNRTPEEKARRAKIRELLQMTNIGSMDDIQNLFKETIAEFMENGLEAELDDKLGYSKYDYKNKDTDNSRNRYSMADLSLIHISEPTSTIEGFNRQLRKVTKSKSVFPTDDSLLKTLYLAMMDITKKWTGRRQDWSLIHAQLSVFFADRMPD